ncbi:MAG TPA: trypsin-like peptidase domain-containing protein [Vicinamibacterales bacterium]|nr:trypsin-like peptidase domain-containing protein [Vicinamibacterales bacterium]
MRRFTVVTIGLVGVVAFLVGLIVAASFGPTRALPTERPSVAAPRDATLDTAATPIAPAPSPIVSFADVADRINAAVVNIDASAVGRGTGRGSRRDPEDWLDRQEENDSRQGAGSGFIIDHEGHILTNAHLVDGAERIVVTLSDGRAFRGRLVGSDPAIDVALVRIAPSASLPIATLGDSDSLRVGEWVCAIGNPLGYVHSVTVGVVSFIGRKLFDPSLDDYIQTDAAINFGNSGGPLINSRGEVVGINAAISSRANNIGFAVPINQAKGILAQLRTRGRVSRGYIGIMLTDVTTELQRSLGLTVNRGAMVQDLAPNSPGERAGIRPYDVITAVDDRDIWTNEELIREISARQPGTPARLHVVRDGRPRDVVVKLAERPAREETEDTERDDASEGRPRPNEIPLTPERRIGLFVRDLDLPFLRRLEMPGGLRGVAITRIDPAGPAFGSALRRGQIIIEINRQPIASLQDFNRVVSAARRGDVLALYVYDPAVRQKSLETIALDTP